MTTPQLSVLRFCLQTYSVLSPGLVCGHEILLLHQLNGKAGEPATRTTDEGTDSEQAQRSQEENHQV
jgi:hypothetical protein